MTTMTKTDHVQGSVCVDCLMGIANGDWPELGENWTADQEQHVQDGMRDYDFTLGHFHADSDCFHAGSDCEDDCECEQTPFSASPCDLCNSFLAGSRDAVTIWFR